MKQPATSPGRGEKQQLPPPPGLARLLLSKSGRRGARSRRAPATSPMFVSRGRRAVAAEGEPSSPKVTCIGQVRMRKGKKKKGAAAAGREKAGRGYCRCLKKAFLCGGLFEFRRRHKAPETPVVERSRRSPWVFSSRDVVASAASPKTREHTEEDDDEMDVFGPVERDDAEVLRINGDGEEEEDAAEAAELVSSSAPPKNALLLMRCRSAPQQNRFSSSPLTSMFFPMEIAAASTLSPRVERNVDEKWQHEQEQEVGPEEDDSADDEEEEYMRCSSARPLVLPRCKSEPATTATAKMTAGTGEDATSSGCFWAHGGSSGRRKHAPGSTASPVALTGH